MENIKQQLEELKETLKNAIFNLVKQNCEVEMGSFQIRQSFSYYEEDVYHIEKAYINPAKGVVRLQLYEYADSIDLKEFSAEDQVGIYEELEKIFKSSNYDYRVEYFYCKNGRAYQWRYAFLFYSYLCLRRLNKLKNPIYSPL